MTNEQLTLILAAIGTVGGTLIATLRWAVNRITKSNDAGTAALVANTASNAVLVVKIDALMVSNQRLADKIDGIGAFVEEHTPTASTPRTPPYGIRTPRRGTHHDGEDE